jgi:hypothetical protein
VEVHCDEGGAIRIGSEPCVHARESMGEASAGERIGQPLSLDENSNRGHYGQPSGRFWMRWSARRH